MSDVGQAIERREGDSLSQILGTGDTRAMLASVERNVRDIIDVCRERGFVTHYVNKNKKTGEVRESDFYGLPAWQLLAMTYGVTPLVEKLDPIDGGWKAFAVARNRDGGAVGSDFGLCQRTEPGKEYKSAHDLAAMASARAKRNALRAAFGAALVLAGFDFADPKALATDDQVGLLHQLERLRGIVHDQGHYEAGVSSYRELNREAASELIEAWTSLVERAPSNDQESSSASEGRPEEPHHDVEATTAGGAATSAQHPSSSTDEGSPGEAPPPVVTSPAGGAVTPVGGPQQDASVGGSGIPIGVPDDASPASNDTWDAYIHTGGTSGRAVKRARERHRDGDPIFPTIVPRSTDLTEAQLQALLDERKAGE
jgi:hypothetical protein